jgi:transposase InsO family protein
MQKILQNIYNNPNNPAGFSGVQQLLREAKKIEPKITKEHVEYFLQGHRTYTLTRPRRVHFNRTKVIPAGFWSDCQVDLADFQSLARHNKGNRYILVAVEVLSRQIYAVPMLKKTAKDMIKALEELLNKMPYKPMRIYSDLGKEFCNKEVEEFLSDQEIDRLEASTKFHKASHAERAIRNLKQRIYRYFSHYKKLNWVEILDDVVDGINHAKNRAHGLRPIEITFKNARKVWNQLYGKYLTQKPIKSKFTEGDLVRQSRGIKQMFEKEMVPSWADHIYSIDSINRQAHPTLYKLKNDGGQHLKDRYYQEELSRVRKEADIERKIEKSTGRKRKLPDGTFEVEVKYVGDPNNKYWIHETELQ